MRFSSNENRNNYYKKIYGFVPGFATREKPKNATSRAAIQNRRNLSRKLASNNRSRRRASMIDAARSRRTAARRAAEEAARRDAISRNPRSTIFNLLSIGQLNKKPSGGYTQRKHRNYRK